MSIAPSWSIGWVQVGFEPCAELAERECGCSEPRVAYSGHELVDPDRLLFVDRSVPGVAELSESDELRATVVSVRDELDHPVCEEAVDGRVNALPREAHATGDLWHGEWSLLERDGTEYLPARRRETVLGCE